MSGRCEFLLCLEIHALDRIPQVGQVVMVIVLLRMARRRPLSESDDVDTVRSAENLIQQDNEVSRLIVVDMNEKRTIFVE